MSVCCSGGSYWPRVHLLRGSSSNILTLRVCNCVQTTQKKKKTKMHILELSQFVSNDSHELKVRDQKK